MDALAIAEDLLAALSAEPGLRVIVGTRRDLAGDRRGTADESNRQGPLLRALGSAHTIDLSTYGAVADIHAYARHRLRTLPGSPYREADEATATLVERLSSRVTELSSGSFFVARIVTLTLASQPSQIEVDDASLAGLLFGDLGKALDADLGRYAYQEGKVRDLLGALAWADGAGLPRRHVWLLVANTLAPEPDGYVDTDLVWVLEHAGAYVTQSGDEGETVYRLYHQALVDHFRWGRDAVAANAAIARALVGTVPVGEDGRLEWGRAAPYLRRHLAQHALAGAIEAGVLADPGLFEVLDADRVVSAVTALYERTGSEENLDRAIRLLRQADAAIATGSPGSRRYGEALDLALRIRAERTNLSNDRDAVAEALRATTRDDLRADADPTIDMALVLHSRYERRGDPVELADAIALYRQTLTLDWPDERRRNLVRTNLSTALQQQWSDTGDRASLDEAVELSQVAARAAHEDDPSRADTSFIASAALRLRFEATGSSDDLREAIEFAQAAAAAADPASARYASYFANCASLLYLDYHLTGALAGLHGAVDAMRRVLATVSEDDPRRPGDLAYFSAVLLDRHNVSGDMPDLDEAIVAGRLAIATAPSNHPSFPDYLSGLGAAHLARFAASDNLADLDEAIDISRRAVDFAPAGHPDRAELLSNLSRALELRLERFGELPDIDEAIMVGRQALAETSEGHPSFWVRTLNLANAFISRFDRSGVSGDLEEAIGLGRRALDAVSAGDPTRPRYLGMLGTALYRRYERFDNPDDLDEAADLLRAAVSQTPANVSAMVSNLTDLSQVLLSRYRRSSQEPDLDDAIARARDALDLTPPAHRERPGRLAGLSAAIATRAEAADRINDLYEAIALMQAAISTSAPDEPATPLYLAHLGGLFRRRSEQTGDRQVAYAAIDAGTSAVTMLPRDHPRRADHLVQLAVSLQLAYSKYGDEAAAERAIEVLDEASATASAPMATRVEAATMLGRLAHQVGKLPYALLGYGRALDLLPWMAWQGVPRAERERRLATWSGVATEAAAAAIDAADPVAALTFLEHGRGILWSQLLEIDDLSTVRSIAPDLASRLETVRRHLDGHGGESPDSWGSPERLLTDQRMALAHEWDQLVEQLRTLPGFEDFLRPPPIEALFSAADDGPVVIINVAHRRCDALVVTATGVSLVPLPDLTHEDVARNVGRYLQSSDDWVEHNRDLELCLQWMWDTFVARILDHLGYTRQAGEGEWPRLWWCPTGSLALLPVHAAGLHDIPGAAVLDRVISSYTPTLRMLMKARSSKSASVGDHERLLLVGMIEGHDRAPLRGVAKEVASLRTLLPDSMILTDAAATRAAVLDALERHRLVHFSGYAFQDLENPSQSRLVLSDGALTVADLTSLRYHGDLAFLSSVRTALGGVALPDEAITLAAAFHYTGYRQVIATLWDIDDRRAAFLTVGVYETMTRDDGIDVRNAARALHQNVRLLRERYRSMPIAWTPYVHIGP